MSLPLIALVHNYVQQVLFSSIVRGEENGIDCNQVDKLSDRGKRVRGRGKIEDRTRGKKMLVIGRRRGGGGGYWYTYFTKEWQSTLKEED